jgi:KR domain
MIERGARHLTFMSRSGTDNPLAAALVASTRALSVATQVLRADITSKEQVMTAMRQVDARYPIRGVVNAAVALQVITNAIPGMMLES